MSKTTSDADVFTDSMSQLAEAARKQKKLLIVVLAIALGALAAYSAYFTKKESRAAAARDALFQARTTAEEEIKTVTDRMKPPAPVEQASKKADPKKPPAEAPRFSADFAKFNVTSEVAKGIPALESVARDFENTRSGYDAELSLGDLYFQHGSKPEDFSKAAGYYENATAIASSNPESALAFYNLAYAQEAEGKCDNAVKTFERALGFGDASLQADLLKGKARCAEVLGDKASARQTYEKMIALFPASELSAFAETKKAALDVAASAKK